MPVSIHFSGNLFLTNVTDTIDMLRYVHYAPHWQGMSLIKPTVTRHRPHLLHPLSHTPHRQVSSSSSGGPMESSPALILYVLTSVMCTQTLI